MSFSGRLSIVDSEPHESVTSTSNSIIPLSIAQRTNMESPSPPTMGIGNLKRLNSRSHQKENRIRLPADVLNDQNYTPYHQSYKKDLMRLNEIPSSTVKSLAKELLDTRAHLNCQQIQARKMRKEHESQLKMLCRQLLNLESGLRKTEQELKAQIQEKDKKIQEQANIIEFLVKKSTTKSVDIKDLCEEAVAKIPQVQPLLDSDEAVSKENEKNLEMVQRRLSDTIIVNVKHDSSQNNNDDLEMSKKEDNKKNNNRVSSNKQDLTSIYEYSDSQNDNDSDSAIIIDDRLMSSSSSLQKSQYKGISRSISDVVSCIASTPLNNVTSNDNTNHEDDDIVKQDHSATTISNKYTKKNRSSIHLADGFKDLGGNEKGQNLPYPPSTCISSLLGNNLNTWYSNDACGSLSPPLLLMRKQQSRMSTHLDTRVNSCSSDEDIGEEEDELFVGDNIDKRSKDEYDKSPFTSANYRGFLLRHGSYERYKSRSLYQQQCNNNNNKNKPDNFNQPMNNGHNESSKMNLQKRRDQEGNLTTSLLTATESTITPLNYCTLPRRSKSVTKLNRQKTPNSQTLLDANQVHISNMSASSSTLIIVNQKTNLEECSHTNKNKFSWSKIINKDKKADLSLSTPSLYSQHYHYPSDDQQSQNQHQQQQQIQIKHKNFMKPRDVKNRSTQKHKQQQKSQEQKEKLVNDNRMRKSNNDTGYSSISKSFSQNVERYVKKNGSVYCSLIMQETDLNSQSFA